MTEKIEQHKDIIDTNNKSFYEMKKAKDAKQNERKLDTHYVVFLWPVELKVRHLEFNSCTNYH
jgi:hypothetical protein